MKLLFSLISAALVLSGTDIANASTGRISPDKFRNEPVKTQTGKASWYGGYWAGRKTANGEIYRPEEMTAAHKTLPFGTFVKVTNVRNGTSTIVRINNRGPYVKGRIIDLSVAAARDLRMVNSGVALVRLDVLAPREENEATDEEASPRRKSGNPLLRLFSHH